MERQGEGVKEAIIEFMKTPAAQNWLALFAGMIALASYGVALINYLHQKNRDRVVQLAENYLRLELESNEVFRFEQLMRMSSSNTNNRLRLQITNRILATKR
jgi:hypothetical protein